MVLLAYVILAYHPSTQEQAPGEESNYVLSAAQLLQFELVPPLQVIQSSWHSVHTKGLVLLAYYPSTQEQAPEESNSVLLAAQL